MNAYKRILPLALMAGLALGSSCVESPRVTAVDAPTTEALSGALTAAGVQALAVGVLAADRTAANTIATLTLPNIYARNIYRIDGNEPRYVTETLSGTPDPASFSGAGGWANMFTAIRAANSLLAALPGAVPSQVSIGERNVTAGLVQTMKALDYYRVLELRDTIGVAYQLDDQENLGMIMCKAKTLDYIAALLDSANTSLVASGGTSLGFTPPAGLTGFGRDYRKAANLILMNRGLKGKIDVYRGLQHSTPVAGAFTAAIAELTQALGGAAPGAVPASAFKTGVYLTFVAGGTENTPNALSDSRIGANPKAAAALQSGDTRASKIIARAALSGNGLSTTLNYVGSATSNTANLTNPIAILRDEEVVLLRAQAYFEAGQFANGAADLNSVRTSYGLAAIAVPSTIAAARTALLYEKRWSLFMEGAQYLVDLRAYGQLRAGVTPAEVAGDPFNTAMPIPKVEADARGGTANLTPSCS